MATWQDLAGYIRSHYKIAEENGALIKLVFEVDGLRSQVVILAHARLFGGAEDWVVIESPFVNIHAVDLPLVLQEVEQTVCGGLSRIGDHLTVRHAVPLLNLNINEFERPLMLVTGSADALEKKFAGTDNY